MPPSAGMKVEIRFFGLCDGALIHPVQAIVQSQLGSDFPGVLRENGTSVQIVNALLVAVGDAGMADRNDAESKEIARAR